MTLRSAPATFALAAIGFALAVVGIGALGWAPSVQAQDSPVRVNEVQSSNQSTLETTSGDTPDWIELFNSSAGSVDLSAWSLSDEPNEPGKWRFPDGTAIAANSTLLVFASGRDGVYDGELHTNFKLSSDGDDIVLFDQPGVMISGFDPLPPLLGDTSWGIAASGEERVFGAPTPGTANAGIDYAGVNLEVAADPPRGVYGAAVQVSLVGAPGDLIRYTLDGSEPTPARGLTYAGPITIDETTALRTAAFRTDWLSSGAVTHTYVFPADLAGQSRMNNSAAVASQAEITQSMSSLATISLTSMVNDSTPRFTFPSNGEAALSVEMILPDGRSAHIDGGAKEVGASSVRYAKDSLRLKFGSEFGASSFDFPVFDGADNPAAPATDSFKRLTLRMGAHDTGFWQHAGGPHRSYLRAAWHDETMLDLGHPGIHTRFVNVFLNGEYWGLYQLREQPDDHFMASYFGGDNEDYLGVNSGAVSSGSGTSWSAFVAASSNWSQLSQIVDPVNYVDFMLVTEYAGNSWDLRANNNWRGAGSSTAGVAGYQFFHSDPDVAMVRVDDDIVRPGARSNFHGPANSWTALHQEADPDFVRLVADRVNYLFFNGGVLTEQAAAARWSSLEAEIVDAVHAEWARWSLMTPATWQTGMNWFGSTYFPARTSEALAVLTNKGHWTPQNDPIDPPAVLVPGQVQWLVGADVSAQFTADSDVMVWSAVGLPPGVSIDPDTGLTSGVVESPGSYPVTISATDLGGRTGEANVTWTVDYPSSSGLVLNEWNAVAPAELITGGDSVLGSVPGNGGDWFELVVTKDHLDVRGWSLLLSDTDNGDEVRKVTDTLVFSDDPLLADLRSGTIITVAEDFADDVSFDPFIDDWNLTFQSDTADSGRYFTGASQSNFSTSNLAWQLLIRDDGGTPVFGPAGEGIGGVTGVGATEVGELETAPSPTTNATSGYDDGDASTFGEPNSSAGIAQDFSALRSWLGDADCNGAVDAGDAQAILAHAVGNSAGGCDVVPNGDMDGDGTAGLLDALVLARSLG